MAGTRTRRHFSIVAKISGVASTYSLSETPGDVTISGIASAYREVTRIMHRGQFAELVYGDDKPVSGSFELYQDRAWTSGGTQTFYDLLQRSGSFAAGSTYDPGGQVPTLEYLQFTETLGGVSSTISLPNVEISADYKVGKDGNMWTVNWVCHWSPSQPISVS